MIIPRFIINLLFKNLFTSKERYSTHHYCKNKGNINVNTINTLSFQTMSLFAVLPTFFTQGCLHVAITTLPNIFFSELYLGCWEFHWTLVGLDASRFHQLTRMTTTAEVLPFLIQSFRQLSTNKKGLSGS